MPDTKKIFSLDDVEEDNFTDEIGVLIKAIQEIPTHTHKKIELISHLKKVGLQTGYIEFRGFTHKFHIGRIGQSYLYDVPLQKKTGHLRMRPITLPQYESYMAFNWGFKGSLISL